MNNRILDEKDNLRTLAFHIYKTQYNAMNGKPLFKNIKKPSDIQSLPQDKLLIHRGAKPEYDYESAKALYEANNKTPEWAKHLTDGSTNT